MRRGSALMAALGLWMGASAARAADAERTLQAGPVRRIVAVRSGVLRTRGFAVGDGDATRAGGPEFRLCVGETPRVLASDGFRAESAGAGSFRLAAPGAPVVTIAYAEDAAAGIIRKTITVTNAGTAKRLLRWVEVESCAPGRPITYAVDPSFPALGDWGQPVLADPLFFGIEFPAARSTALPDGSLQLREYPGVWLDPGASWTSHAAVVGCAASGTVEAAFLEYVAGISPHAPRVPRPFITWNGFRVIKPPDRTGQGLLMVERAKELKALTGFAFDSWTYDAGFDMYRPDALFVPREGDLWKKTREALAPVGTPLGFWASFSSIFDTPTHAWGKTQGFGLQHDSAYCLAEPTYAKAIEERLVAIVRAYDMRSINFDGMYRGQGYGCDRPGHGHLAGEGKEAGIYGTYAVVAKEMEIFRRLRAEQPSICMDLFVCGEWASPWWLSVIDGVHTVPGDTVAASIPSPWLRDALITARDVQVWDLHKRLRRQFPLWAEDLYGNQVRADHLIDGISVRGESTGAHWEDELVMALAARGALSAYIVCCDLHVLARTRSGLRFLGEVGEWVRANAPIYRHTALVGGEPAKGEPYGYVHGDGKGRALLGLRNPSIRTQLFPLRIGPEFRIGTRGPYQVTMVYPHRYTWPSVEEDWEMSIPLPDFAVALFEIRDAATAAFPGLPDGRWSEEEGDLLVGGLDLEPPAPAATLRVADPRRAEIEGEVTIPLLERVDLQIRVDPPAGTKNVKANVSIDGAAAKAEVHFRDRGATQDAWVIATIPRGKHRITVSIDAGTPVRLEGWFRYAVTQRFHRVARHAPAGLFPALDPGELRRTCPAFPAVVAGGDQR
ncbi:MAG: hypothetical protein JXP34_09555 [Planctomycetes bacterium]|nr:hypothetical protein [Planctomycetota bacterium]